MSSFMTVAPTVIATGGTILSLIALKVETDSKTQAIIRLLLSISASSALVGIVFQLPDIVGLLKKVRHQIFEEGLMYEYLGLFLVMYIGFFTWYILYDLKTEKEKYPSLYLFLFATFFSLLAATIVVFYLYGKSNGTTQMEILLDSVYEALLVMSTFVPHLIISFLVVCLERVPNKFDKEMGKILN